MGRRGTFGRDLSIHGLLQELVVVHDLLCDVLEGHLFAQGQCDAPGGVLPVKLKLVDLVGAASHEPVPPRKVVVDVALRRVLDEDEGDANGLETVQDCYLALRLPGRLGLGLQLEVRVDHQGGHLLLGARAFPCAAERVRQECCHKVPVLHYFFERDRVVTEVLRVVQQLG